ncbi:alpha-crystallin B chain [Folsomia candida]|uniref:Alpha-crystallin B chain n=1 Tax=Folsomia candida TaxID=158441 RepID=A0A226EGZ2_FOLCA|nr:alpha-crystallin B chain [Folsomia candida]OXA56344.1 Alpha-crystallin B chain [Folsomia candida]
MNPWIDRLDLDSRSLVDQYLGTGWDADEFVVPTSRFYSRYRHPRVLRPSSWVPDGRDGTGAERNASKDIFSVKLDVHQFRENELTVKTKDNNLIISASHEEREDPQGFISRQFTRRYVIPDDVKLDQLVCNISTDGILTIDAPKKSGQPGGETVIPIRPTGRPAVVTSAPSTAAPTTPTPSAPSGKESRSQTIPIERESAPAPPSS